MKADDAGDPAGIVVVTHYFPAHGGGIELVAARLAEKYLERAVPVTWIASSGDAPPSDGGGIEHIPVPSCNAVERLTQLPYPLWSPAVLPLLWRKIGRARAVHVHEHLYIGSLAAIAIAAMRKRPLVITQHMGDLRLSNPLLTWLYRATTKAVAAVTMRAASRVAFVSANVAEFFRRSTAGHGKVVFNGLDTKVFRYFDADGRHEARGSLGLPLRAPIAVFAGRYVPKKGLDLLRAMAQAAPEVHWVFAGSGPLSPANWMLPNVTNLGKVDQQTLAHVFAAGDVLVLPSRGEGFPLVVQEALACGIAVLTTREVQSACPPAEDLICGVDEPTDPGNVQPWNDRLLQIVACQTDDATRCHRAARASSIWSWDRCADAYVEMLFEQHR